VDTTARQYVQRMCRLIRLRWLPLIALALAARPARAQPVVDARAVAAADTSLRIIVSVARRRLWVVERRDTLLAAPVAVGTQRSMAYGAHRWTFTTPRGVRTVRAKERDPVWIPPDWHYVEVARREHFRIVWLHGDTTIDLHDGSRLVMRHLDIRIEDDSTYDDDFAGYDIVSGNTLFVPPIGSPARRVAGELGKYRLDLGDGVGIHGTRDASSVGTAATHGCMRLHDADVEWLYEHIPVGTKVYIY
jgi:lipoprotein-anchoring transpeptidase ErfK/SrfK